jgi:hypothetical protein
MTIYSDVNRDGGIVADASDWFDICNLGGLKAQGVTNVAFFIDESGSMNRFTVQASLDLLSSNMANEGLTLVSGTYNARENWIEPFLRDF